MKTSKFIVAGLTLVPLASFAAEDLSYTYIEADYVNVDIDDYGEDGDFLDEFDNGDGWALRGSYGFDSRPVDFIDSWFIFGNYTEFEADTGVRDDTGIFFPADTDITRIDLGVGVAMPVNDRSDLNIRVGYSDLDIGDFNVGGTSSATVSDLDDDSSDGYFVDAALRSQVTPMMELSGGVRYTDIEEVDGFGFIGNALFEINEGFGINIFADLGSDVGQYGVGARFSF